MLCQHSARIRLREYSGGRGFSGAPAYLVAGRKAECCGIHDRAAPWTTCWGRTTSPQSPTYPGLDANNRSVGRRSHYGCGLSLCRTKGGDRILNGRIGLASEGGNALAEQGQRPFKGWERVAARLAGKGQTFESCRGAPLTLGTCALKSRLDASG